MTSPRFVAGSLLAIVPVVFMAGFTGLQVTFGYPDILRRPAGEVLTRFAEGGADLHLYWYAMFASALALIAGSIAMGISLWERDRLIAGLSIGFGALAGLVQGLGLLRWVILVPMLAGHYTDPAATDIDRVVTTGLFDFANQYLGAGVGEHVGYMFTAVWTALIATLLMRDHRVIALSGYAIGLGIAFGLLEPFGVALAGPVVAIAFSLWAVWTLAVGIMTLRGSRAGFARVVPQAA